MVQIVDASVAIKWFLLEPGHEAAISLLKQILSSPDRFAVPELFFFELTHIFHRLILGPSEAQLMLLKETTQWGIHRFSMTADLIDKTRRFQELGLSGYDASYVAVAESLKGKWVTFDSAAHHRLKGLNLSELLE